MLEARLLGQFDLKLDGAPVTLTARAAQSLLAYLLLHPGTAHRREKLAGLLWPDTPETSARNNLRQALHRIRRALDPGGQTYLLADDLTIEFDANAGYWLDAAVMEQKPSRETADDLMRVVSVYAGELLPGFYDDWVVLERERLQTVFERRMKQLLERLVEARRWPEVLEWGERWIALGHTPEPAYRALMMAHANLGDVSGVATVFQRCVEALRRDLEVEPSEQTRALYERLSRGEAVAGAPAEAAFQSRYRLDSELGRGGMAVVYRAYDTLLEREVAVKVLMPGTLGTEGRARLLSEARAVAKLNHPNIVAVYDAGEKDGSAFIVMELIQGESLHTHRPQSLGEILSITRQICAALDHAHAQGIVHRDLKPENVLLSQIPSPYQGEQAGVRAKLVDFGLARSMASRLTAEGTIIGTVFYLAPEQALGQAVDGRADLYALGVMLYELTTGRLPFEADDPLAVISQHLHAPVVPPRTYNSEIPDALDALIVRLLSKQPHDRPGSAREVMEALSVEAAASPLPTGTVTFLISDIEGFTSRMERDPAEARETLARHDALLHPTMAEHNGRVFKVMGDAFMAVFAEPVQALMAALTAQRRLSDENWGVGGPLRVRMALHMGPAELHGDDDYLPNETLIYLHRLIDIRHGGQILLSQAMAEAVRGHLPAGARLEDLGEQNVKGFRQAQSLFRVAAPGVPVDVSPSASPSVPRHNLPTQLSSFIGREREIVEVKRLLSSSRLVTLTGAGGCGKTRLALHVAADVLNAFADGAWFVELAPLSDPALVLQAVASALGVREDQGRPLMTALLDHARTKQLLLVLDNCEHLIEACAQLADTLLRASPSLRILATSREALNIVGETIWPIPSLSLPDPQSLPALESLMRYDSLRLFIERAAAARPDFAMTKQNSTDIVQVCQRLDGLPLAIELAAPLVKALTVEQITERLKSRFQLLTHGSRTSPLRHQTLRAMMDWSYKLLSTSEQSLLQRLSIFAGGWALEAAEAVCSGDGVEGYEILHLLTQLVDKSLVMAQEGATRYRMLETIREYAREKLEEAGEAKRVCSQHLNFFVKFAEEAEQKLKGAEQSLWLNRVEADHDNIQAGLEGSQKDGGVVSGLRLAGALGWFWWRHGYIKAGCDQLTVLLSQPEAARRTSVRAKALNAAGLLALLQGRSASRDFYEESRAISTELGDKWNLAYALLGLGWVAFYIDQNYLTARSLCEESLAIFREIHDRWGAAWALNNLGLAVISLNISEHPAARTLIEESLTIRRELDDRWGIAKSLSGLGRVAFGRGDLDAARAIAEEGLEIVRELGDKWDITGLLAAVANAAMMKHDYTTARSHYEESLLLARDVGDRGDVAYVLNALGEIARLQNDYQLASILYSEALALRREIGEKSGIIGTVHNLGHIALHEGDYARAIALFKESLALTQTLDEAWLGTVVCLAGLAGVATAMRQPERAARLFGAAEALIERRQLVWPPADRAEYDRNVAAARAQLDESTFNAAWAEGRAMTLEQAIAYALQTQAPSVP